MHCPETEPETEHGAHRVAAQAADPAEEAWAADADAASQAADLLVEEVSIDGMCGVY